MKLSDVYDKEVLETAKEFKLEPMMVAKLYKGDPVKLTFEWVKTGKADLKMFKKLLDYISHQT